MMDSEVDDLTTGDADRRAQVERLARRLFADIPATHGDSAAEVEVWVDDTGDGAVGESDDDDPESGAWIAVARPLSKLVLNEINVTAFGFSADHALRRLHATCLARLRQRVADDLRVLADYDTPEEREP